MTERVIVASKERFDRARTVRQRAAEGLPHEGTVMTEDFLALTLDVWSIPSESARRVGHPAPFPVELPEQLIRLYTFKGDLVLDPFMGSGSALVAAARLGRRYIGYDLDPEYVAIARRRVEEALANDVAGESEVVPVSGAADGRTAKDLAEKTLVGAGFTVTGRKQRIRVPASASTSLRAIAEGRRGGSTSLARRAAIATGCCRQTSCGARSDVRTRCARSAARPRWSC